MCTGFEIFMAAASLGTALVPLMQKAPEPPPLPALAPAGSRAPGATVRIGTGQDEKTNTDANAPNAKKFTPMRSEGKAIGNLGRGGLAL